MLSVNELAMAYGQKLLFANVNLIFNKSNRYGLVGANGCGKSTFLKTLAGVEEPNFGEVVIAKRSTIGWLKQDQFHYESTPIIETVIAGKKELIDAMNEKKFLLEMVCDEKIGFRLGELEQIIADNDGYSAEYIASELLVGLGIKEEYHYQNLSVLSGGYKLRVLLAQSLFNNPDLLLLDEPTNHLDIDSINWLEKYLKEVFKGVLIFISHDISFINNLATHILDIDYGEVKEYVGNYYKFVEQKQQIMEQKLHELNYVEKKMEKMQKLIDRFRFGTRARLAQSREKTMDKIELPNIQKSSRISPHFNFKQKRPSGKIALKTEHLVKNYGDKKILVDTSFMINRGEKVIVIGPNGVGKSTLLKILVNKVASDSGNYEWGYEAQFSYFAQDHHDLLNENITVFEWLKKQVTTAPENVVRNILGQVLFKQDDAHKNILSLSGGEGARLLLAKIILEEGNILVLDEPTNHLDIESKNALKQALINYPGTLLMVTHDRDFVESIATRIIALGPRKMIDFKGSYPDYNIRYNK